MNPLLEQAARTAATALLDPIIRDVVAYLTGQRTSLPDLISNPSPHGARLAARIALDARKARDELAAQRGADK